MYAAEQVEPQFILLSELVTVPLPVPDLATVSVCCGTPSWVIVKVSPSIVIVIVPVLVLVPVLAETL
jgi:hypothetical protein